MAASARITVSPTRRILDVLERPWSMTVPKHRLARIALQLGLDELARLEPDEFRQLVVDDAVASAGIKNP